jgi:hypothetical protein
MRQLFSTYSTTYTCSCRLRSSTRYRVVARLARRKRASGCAIGRVRVGSLAHLTSCQLEAAAVSTGPAWPRRVSSPVWQRRGSGAVVLLRLLATLRRRPRQMPKGKGAQSLDLGGLAALAVVSRPRQRRARVGEVCTERVVCRLVPPTRRSGSGHVYQLDAGRPTQVLIIAANRCCPLLFNITTRVRTRVPS